MKADILITNALLVTMDGERRIIEDGALAVAEGRIAAVGPRAEVEAAVQAAEVMDAGGNVVLPGFVDALGHAGRTLARPESADRPVQGAKAVGAFLRGAGADFWQAEGQLNAAQSLNLGITTVQRLMPPVAEGLGAKAGAYLRALDDAGLTARVVLSPGAGGAASAGGADLAACAELLAEDARYGLCLRGPDESGLYPRATPEQPPEGLAAEGAAIRAALAALGAPAPAAGKGCARLCYAAGGELRWLLKEVPDLLAGALMLFGLHGAGFDELARLREAGASYLYSPETFLPNAHLSHAMFEGVPCAITPASMSGRYPADLLLTGRRAVLYEVTSENDYHYTPAGKVLELITCEAAEAIGMAGEVGSLAVGKRADINIFQWKAPALTPNFMPVQMLIFRGYGQDIKTVMAGGRFVKKNGRLVGAPDLAGILARGPRAAGQEGA